LTHFADAGEASSIAAEVEGRKHLGPMHLAKPKLQFSGEETASHNGGNTDQWSSSAMPSQIGAKQKRGNTGVQAWRRLGDPPGLKFRDNREQPSFNLARGACSASVQGTLSVSLLRTGGLACSKSQRTLQFPSSSRLAHMASRENGHKAATDILCPNSGPCVLTEKGFKATRIDPHRANATSHPGVPRTICYQESS